MPYDVARVLIFQETAVVAVHLNRTLVGTRCDRHSLQSFQHIYDFCFPPAKRWQLIENHELLKINFGERGNRGKTHLTFARTHARTHALTPNTSLSAAMTSNERKGRQKFRYKWHRILTARCVLSPFLVCLARLCTLR